MNSVQRKNRLIIVVVAGLFFLPVIASIVLNSNLVDFQPTPQTNRGTLIQPPVALSSSGIVSTEGQQLVVDRFDGRWTVVVLVNGPCERECGEIVDGLVRTDIALNVRADQVDHVVLDLADQLDVADYVGFDRDDVYAAHAGDNQALIEAIDEAGLGPAQAGQTFIANAGYLMMAYSPQQTGADVLKDLQRLTRARGRDEG